MLYLEVRRLLEGRSLLEGDPYFNVDTQVCGAYKKVALIRGNTVRENVGFNLSNIYHRTFNCLLFLQKSFLIDASQIPRCSSDSPLIKFFGTVDN